jgi:TolA-binding protein
MVATLTRLLEEFPNSPVAPNAHFLFGEHLYDAKQYADAAKHYDACAKALKGEELAKALYKLAWCHYHSFDLAQDRPEKLDEAAATFSDLLRRVPESTFLAEAHYLIGLILQRQNKHQDAIAAFQKALASEPSPKHEEGALYQTGQSQQALGKWADALKSHKGTLEKFPDGEMKLDATCGVGLASQHLGAYADAQDAYKKVIAATKTELAARAQYGLGECDFLQEKYKDALARFLAIEITYAYDKWSAAALLKVAECHAKLGNADRARFYADDLAKKFPNSELLPQARKLVESLRAKKPE